MLPFRARHFAERALNLSAMAGYPGSPREIVFRIRHISERIKGINAFGCLSLSSEMGEYTENQNETVNNNGYAGGSEGRDRRKRSGFLPGLIVGILSAVTAVGILFAIRGSVGTAATANDSQSQASTSDKTVVSEATVSKLQEIERIIDRYYYKSGEVTAEQKSEGMYKGLMNSLGDIYSCYYTAEEYKELQDEISGIYYGIGAYVSRDVETGACVISGVIKDSPAEAGGLMEGDIIYRIEGEDITGLDLDEVVGKIRGDEGTKVKLTVIRSGETIELELTRGKVNSPTVESEMLENDIGYLQITEFEDVTPEQFNENMASLKEQGMKGLIIDLRGNPGGKVTSVCAIAEQLLPEGLIFYMEDKNGKKTEYPCKGADFDLPLVVLVNGYSASASEILSGAVKDSGIGTIVGKKTYGKGVVQNLIDLEDGSAVKLTIANYYTRNGNDINLKGIEPDVEVDLDTDKYLEDRTDTQRDKAIEVLLEKMN